MTCNNLTLQDADIKLQGLPITAFSRYTTVGRGRNMEICFWYASTDGCVAFSARELSQATGIYQRTIYARIKAGVSLYTLIHPGNIFNGALAYIAEHGFICRTVLRDSFDLSQSNWKTFAVYLDKSDALSLVELVTPSSTHYFIKKDDKAAMEAAKCHANKIAATTRDASVRAREDLQIPWWIRSGELRRYETPSVGLGAWTWYSVGGGA